MIPDNENSVDPTVQTIVEMFPEDFLRFECYQGAKAEIRGKSEDHIEHK